MVLKANQDEFGYHTHMRLQSFFFVAQSKNWTKTIILIATKVLNSSILVCNAKSHFYH